MSTTSGKQRNRRQRKSKSKAASSAVSRMGSTNGGSLLSSLSSSSNAPTAMGFKSTSSTFGLTGYRGPRMSDVSTDGAVTIIGSSMWTANIATGALSNGLFAGFSSWAFQFHEWGRLNSIADIYAYYRIRKLSVTLIPNRATVTDGIWCIGLNDGSSFVDTQVGDNCTVQVVANFPNACIGSVWRPITSHYRYNGPKVWVTKTDDAVAADNWQIDMLATSSGLGISTSYGLAYAEYEIDFLLPSAINGTPVLSQGAKYKAHKELMRAKCFEEEATRLQTSSVQKEGKEEDYIVPSPNEILTPHPSTRSIASTGVPPLTAYLQRR